MSIAISIATFLAAFISLRHLQPQGVLFYQGIATGLGVAVLQLVAARLASATTWTGSLKDSTLTFLLIYAFLFTVPTTVDRSYTVKMLGHLADAPHGLTRAEIGETFVHDLVEAGGVDRRIVEQRTLGSLQERDGRFELTRTGRMLNWTFHAARAVFACD